MGILKSLTDNASGISAASSFLGSAAGIGNLLFGNSSARKQARFQQQLQLELMQKQNELAQQNATIDYQRQRELIADNALLTKLGRRQAGLSTAGDYTTSASSAPQISAPSVPSAPSMSDPSVRMLQGVEAVQASANTLLDSSIKQAQKANLDSQTERQNIANAFAIDKEIAEVYKLQKDGEISQAEANTRLENLNRLRSTTGDFIEQQHQQTMQQQLETQRKDFEVKQEAIKADILAVTKQLTDEQLKQAKFITDHQFEQYTLQLKETLSRIKLNNANAQAAIASAAASQAQAMYTRLQTQLESAKIPYADKLAKSIADNAENAAKASAFDLVGHEREAKYQKFAMDEEDTDAFNVFRSIKLIFDNTLGAISFSGKIK
ncbi:hypothetical protein [Microvirus sp.]|nr:hypothetical protein [Microvirus sp.]